VEVTLQDGSTLVQAADERYRGSPEKPFTRAELHAKFADCAALVLPSDRIPRALETIESLESVKDIRQLVQVLTPSATQRRGSETKGVES
jgi:2-methylcitrate dehydratase PrpD